MLLFWYPKVLKCRFSSRSYSNARLVVVEFYRSLGDTDLHNCGHTTGGAISKYQHAVFDLLDHAKEEADTFHPDSLIDLQNKIERLTYPYDDMKSIYQVAPQIIILLIKNEEDSAMEFLKKSPKLTPEELIILNGLRRYTLEGIIVHVFGLLFNSIEESPAVRLSTLVDHLDRTVRTQARLMFERGKRGGAVCLAEPPVDDKTRHIGILLVEFLLERNLISITNDLSISSQKIEIKNKEGKYYKKRASYVFCNFDTGILPIQLNLPMVCPPKDWGVVNSTGEKPTSISDLSGGYLCEPFGDMYFYNRHNLLAARDKDKFNIILNDNYEDMCHTMNALQKESFEINVDMLNYLKDNYRELVKEGLLMPTVLASINIPVAIKRLRSVYLLYNKYAEGESVSYPSVLKEFLSDVQRARYEKFLIDIASAYAGYEFYLPAYVDFRGRIYRSGVLHFHERDIARSLIVFSKRTVNEGMKKNPNAGLNTAEFMYAAATAFHYQKYPTYEDAVRAFWDISAIKKDSDLIELATRAKEPFQLLSKVVTLREESSKVSPSQLPITQDASASAYQIISYLMLDFELAKYTNIIPAKAKDKQNYCINDVYTFFLEELTKYFKGADQRKNIKDCDFISSQVCPRIDRNLAKLIGAGAATIALAGAAVGIGNVFSSTQPTFSSYSATSAIFSLLFYSFFYFAIYLKMRGIDRALADLYAWQKREEESIDFFLQLGFLLSLFFSFIYIYPWVFTYIERDNLINPLQVVVQLSCFFFNFKWRGDEIQKKHLTLLCFLGGVISTLLLKEIHFGFLPLFLSGLCFYTYLFHRQYFLTAGLLFYTLHPGLARWGFFLLFQQLVYYNLSKLLEKDQPILKRGVVYSYISLLVLFSFLGFPTIFYFLKEPARLAALVSGASIVFLCTKPGLDPLSITFLWILYFFASGILGFICSEEGFDGLIIFFLLHFQFLCGIAIFKKSLPRERQSIVPLFFGFFFYFVPYFPHLEWLETWAEGFDLLLFFLSLFLFIEESQARKIEDITAGTGKASG